MVPCDNTTSSDYWCCGTSRDCCGTSRAIKIPQFPGQSTTTSTASTATSTATSSPSSSQSSSQSSSASSGIGTSAKAGIGVGVGVIVVGGLLVFLFRRRTNKAVRTSVDSTYQLAPAPQELEARRAHEMPAFENAKKSELSARQTEKYELPT